MARSHDPARQGCCSVAQNSALKNIYSVAYDCAWNCGANPKRITRPLPTPASTTAALRAISARDASTLRRWFARVSELHREGKGFAVGFLLKDLKAFTFGSPW